MLLQLPTIIRMAWKAHRGVIPVVEFNYELYKQLVKTCPTSSVEAEPEHPEVEFVHGPIDGALGYFDYKTKRITVDILEIMMVSIDDEGVKSHEDFVERYDARITQVLAHEGGHWHLDKKHGWIPIAEKMLIMAVIVIIGFALMALFAFTVFTSVSYISSAIIGAFPVVVAWISLAALYLFELWLLYRFYSFSFRFWKLFSISVTYQICYHERFARKFEKNIDLNPNWHDVVKVEMT